MYNYGYEYGNATTDMLGIMGGLTLGIFIFSSIIELIMIISYAKIFAKAGKRWWASIVPIYNIVIMIQIAKLPMWYIALFFVPIANIYALFKINIEIAKKFGKETGFGIGMTLLSVIFIPLLAFSDNKYEDNNVVSESTNNQFDANNIINNNVSVDDANVNSPIGNIEVSPVSIENVSVESTPTNVAPIENVSVEPTPVSVAPVENIPVEPAPISVAPVENIPVEPTPVSVAPVENIPVEPTPVSVAPVENIPVESAPINVAQMENVAVESAPINVAPMENVSVEPEFNAFNIAPEIPNTTEPNANEIETMDINEPIISEELNVNNTEDLAANISTDKKVCKNCGNELPDIVSICPNCGTDNE